MRTRNRRRNKERELTELAARYKSALDSIPGEVALLDRNGVIVAVNAKWKESSEGEGVLDSRVRIGANYVEVCEAAGRAGDAAAMSLVRGLREVLRGEARRFTEDYPSHEPGHGHWSRCSVTPLAGSARGGAVVLHTEISDLVRMRETVNRQDMALRSSADAIFIVDTEGRIDWANEAFERASGYTADETRQLGRLAAAYTPGFGELRSIFGGADGPNALLWNGEVALTNKSGEHYLAYQTVTPIRSTAGEVTHYVVIQADITNEKRLQTRMQFISEHDELTGSWNRKSFHERLAAAIPRHEASASRLAVFFVDIDRFKDTNDTLGHQLGDKVLVAVSRRLQQCIREQDTLARFGGDEFAILVEGISTREAALRIAELLLSAFEAPVAADEQEVAITASVGVTVFPDDGTTAETLLRNADLAVYQAKVSGRRGHQFFDRGIEKEMRQRVEVERELSQCVNDSQLWVAFQPQTRLDHGGTSGVECLLRWRRSGALGVSISKVVQIAEECGMILPIGEWVMREAFAQLGAWRGCGHPIELALNLSAVQIHEQDVFGIITGLGKQYGIPLDAVKVEITESVLLNRTDRVKKTLQSLRGAGIGLVLDDFGTGYASLSYLQQFPIGTVKIDSSFVGGIGSNAAAEAIVRGIVKLAHSLGQDVVAEGVETRLQLDFLRDCGCDRAQGYLISRPLPAAEFLEYLNGRQALGQPA